jgi:hypothetical protein
MGGAGNGLAPAKPTKNSPPTEKNSNTTMKDAPVTILFTGFNFSGVLSLHYRGALV